MRPGEVIFEGDAGMQVAEPLFLGTLCLGAAGQGPMDRAEG